MRYDKSYHSLVLFLILALQPIVGWANNQDFLFPAAPYMGFTPVPYSLGNNEAERMAALDDVYAFIHQNADIIAHHLDDGIPWQEALTGQPFHPNEERNLRNAYRGKGRGKRYISHWLPSIKTEALKTGASQDIGENRVLWIFPFHGAI